MKKISLLIILFLAVPGYFLVAQTVSTIFQSTDAPANPLANDGNAISVGVKFRVSQTGVIAGIRFYKGPGTSGTHTGQLYASNGNLLASAVFTNEGFSGWQEVLFTSPVSVVANTTYVATMHSSSGDYCFTNPYFSQAVTSGPLKALANGEDGVNGLYLYTSTPAFPTNNYQSGNYWVDIVYTVPPINGTTNYLPKFLSANFIGNSLIYDNGTSVGIGTSNVNETGYKLFVETGIRSRKVKVDQNTWSDYVFNPDYHLPSLLEVQQFINQYKHLPDVPSTKEVQTNGLDLGDGQAILLKKIEELTLYIIEQNKKLEEQEKRIQQLEQARETISRENK